MPAVYAELAYTDLEKELDGVVHYRDKGWYDKVVAEPVRRIDDGVVSCPREANRRRALGKADQDGITQRVEDMADNLAAFVQTRVAMEIEGGTYVSMELAFGNAVHEAQNAMVGQLRSEVEAWVSKDDGRAGLLFAPPRVWGKVSSLVKLPLLKQAGRWPVSESRGFANGRFLTTGIRSREDLSSRFSLGRTTSVTRHSVWWCTLWRR